MLLILLGLYGNDSNYLSSFYKKKNQPTTTPNREKKGALSQFFADKNHDDLVSAYSENNKYSNTKNKEGPGWEESASLPPISMTRSGKNNNPSDGDNAGGRKGLRSRQTIVSAPSRLLVQGQEGNGFNLPDITNPNINYSVTNNNPKTILLKKK